VLEVPAKPAAVTLPDASAVLAPGAKIEKLEDGFFSISGAAVDPAGKLYFVDHHQQRIYGWSPADGLTIERDNPLDPVNLAFDKAGDLLVVSSAGPEGTVYAFRPGTLDQQITVLSPLDRAPSPNAAVILPGNYWNNGEFEDQLDLRTFRFKTPAEMFRDDVTTPKKHAYVSPDGSAVLPAGRVFQQGPANETSGWRFSDNLDTYGLLSARAGQRIYVSSSAEDRTYSAAMAADGTLKDLRPFADRGGESVALGPGGNVYVANGEVFVYDPTGKQIAELDVPERPIDILFGGVDRRTLFILAHHALYAVKVRGAQDSPR
jgi:sugar lactone lactonase YvrE